MPIHLTNESSEPSKWAIWRIEESVEELEARIPHRIRRTDPLLQQQVFAKRTQRMAVRALLQEVFPEGAPIRYEGKRPCLGVPDHHISITHDPEYVGIQISTKDLPAGIDLQKKRPEQLQRVADRFLSREELRWVDGMDEEERVHALNILWCAKESLYKVCQCSLRDRMQVAPFSPTPKGTLAASVRDSRGKNFDFELSYLSMGEHHMVHILDSDFI